jgi:hypothetical protein
LSVGASNQFTVDSGGNVEIGSTIGIGSTTGVGISAASGVLTLAGIGNTNNENLTLNFETTTANQVAIASSTGVSNLKTSGMGLWLDGTTGALPTTGAGTRLMWIPASGAFRAGVVTGTQWNTIGTNSFATGYNTIASAAQSFASGLSTEASNTYATAMGALTTASGNNSTAMGYLTTASAAYSFALGASFTNSTASSFAVGFNAIDLLITTGLADFQDTNITTTGTGTFSGGIITKDNTSAPTLATNGQMQTAHVGSDYRLYFYSDGAQHYASMTAGFTIPGFETADPISGDKMKIGDIVLGMINQNVGDEDNSQDSSLHGIWVKWDSVKAQLLAEARGELAQSGTWGTGSISGVSTETLLDKVTNVLTGLGISIKDGVTSITTLVTEKFTTKTARMDKMEMVATNGDIYCTWIDANGDWQKIKGDCSSADVAAAATAALNLAPTLAVTSTATSETEASAASIDQVSQQLSDLSQQLTQQQSTQPAAANSQQTQEAIDIAQQAQQTAQRAAQQAQQAQQTANQAQSTASEAQQTAQQTQEQVQQQPQAVNITSVASIADINVDYGTDLASANLPTTINVTLSDSPATNSASQNLGGQANQTVAITWDNGTPAYNPNTSGTYVFSGTLAFSGSITNTNNLTAVVNVIVAQEPVSNATGDLIHSAASSLLNGVWNFIKVMFVSGAKAASSVPIVQKASNSLINASTIFQSLLSSSEIKSLATGLIGPIVKWLRW